MSDTLLRAIARDAGIQICAASTTELVERAHEIHNTTLRSARLSASVIRMAMCAAICRTRLSICRCVRTAS